MYRVASPAWHLVTTRRSRPSHNHGAVVNAHRVVLALAEGLDPAQQLRRAARGRHDSRLGHPGAVHMRAPFPFDVKLPHLPAARRAWARARLAACARACRAFSKLDFETSSTSISWTVGLHVWMLFIFPADIQDICRHGRYHSVGWHQGVGWEMAAPGQKRHGMTGGSLLISHTAQDWDEL